MNRGETYPDWVATRTEWKACKRQSDVNGDESGRREYSIFPCPHCRKDVEMLTSAIKKIKKQIIDDHLIICPEFEGERPSKRWKPTKATTTSLVPYRCTNPTHVAQGDKLAQLQADIDVMKERMDRQEKQLNVHQGYFVQLADVLQLPKPPDPPVIIETVTTHEKELLELKAGTNALVTSQDAERMRASETMIEQQRALITANEGTIRDLKHRLDEVIERENNLEMRASSASKTALLATQHAQDLSQQLERERKERVSIEIKYKQALKANETIVRQQSKVGQSLLRMGSGGRASPKGR